VGSVLPPDRSERQTVQANGLQAQAQTIVFLLNGSHASSVPVLFCMATPTQTKTGHDDEATSRASASTHECQPMRPNKTKR
jgi:hypothetical protein